MPTRYEAAPSTAGERFSSYQAPPLGTKKSTRFAIPFLTTRLVTDVGLYFLMQPLFWVLGIELLIPALLAPWMLVKRALINPKLRIPRQFWWALALMGWHLLHVFTLPPGEFDLFIKSSGTMLALLSLFLVIYNVATLPDNWNKIVKYIEWFGWVVVVLGALYVVGILTIEFRSVIGILLPGRILAGSHFFSTITTRALGYLEIASGLPRIRSTFWHPSSYASILLVLFAIQWFQFRRYSGKVRIVRLGALLLIVFNLFFTLSRTTYVSFVIMLFFMWWLEGRTYRSRLQKLLLLALMAGAILAYVLLMLLLNGTVSMDWLHYAIYKIRPYSLVRRTQIYETSWLFIRQRPFWGWGTLIKIEDLPSRLSAGSHSDYLSVLFRYGIPGLLFYLGFLISTLWALWKGYRVARQSEIRSFLGVSVALTLAMVLRQSTSELLWDVYVASALWATWALGLALLSVARTGKRFG